MNKAELLRYIDYIKRQETGSCQKAAIFPLDKSGLETNGTVSGYFARYDRIADSYGDVCLKGFLNDSIAKREATGHPFPLLYNHNYDYVIGAVTSIEDTLEGAFMTAELFNTPKAQEVRGYIKSGILWQMSFAYNTLEQGTVVLPNGKQANELRKCELYEISVVFNPAQPLSVITDSKSQAEHLEEQKQSLLEFINRESKRCELEKRDLLNYIARMGTR